MLILLNNNYSNFRDRKNWDNMVCKKVWLMQDRLRNWLLQLGVLSSQCIIRTRPLVQVKKHVYVICKARTHCSSNKVRELLTFYNKTTIKGFHKSLFQNLSFLSGEWCGLYFSLICVTYKTRNSDCQCNNSFCLHSADKNVIDVPEKLSDFKPLDFSTNLYINKYLHFHF